MLLADSNPKTMPIDATELRTLRERLRPWYDALRALGVFENWNLFQAPLETAVTRVLWMDSPIEQEEVAQSMMRACEGLALLALLNRIDCATWVYTLEDIWPESGAHGWIESKLVAGEYKLLQQYSIGIHVDAITEDSDIAFVSTFNASSATPSDEFQDVCALYQAKLPTTDRRLDSIPVQLEVENFEYTASEVSRALEKIVSLVRHGHEKRNESSVIEMKIKEVTFAGTSLCSGVDLQGLRYCEQLVKMGVRLGCLPELALKPAGEQSREVFDNVRPILNSASGTNSIFVSDRQSLESVFRITSAAQKNSSARIIDIDLCSNGRIVEDTAELWQWVAYTIFSRFANHQISRLDLTLESIEDDDVSAIKQIMQSSYAPSTLVELPHDPTGPWLVTAKRFNLASPIEPPRILEVDEPLTVQVAGRDSESTDWTVILPGKGYAWVNEGDVLAPFQEEAGHRVRTNFPQFERIDIVRMFDESLNLLLSCLVSSALEQNTSMCTRSRAMNHWTIGAGSFSSLVRNWSLCFSGSTWNVSMCSLIARLKAHADSSLSR